MGQLADLPVPVPPLAIQQSFSALVCRFERLRTRQREAERQAEHLFQTLLDRAFCGELAGRDQKAKPVFVSHATVVERQAPTTKRDNLVPIAAASRSDARSEKDSKGRIFYRRAAVDCYVMQALRGDANLGRTKMEKISHLIEYHCGINLEREPVRDAAGPNDFPSRMKVESLARKQQWYFTSQHADHGRVRYSPGPNIEKSRSTAERFLGQHKRAVDELLSIMRSLDTEQSEILATLYAAWNDFLLAGKNPSDAEIVDEVRNKWHSRKRRFAVKRYLNGLNWIRKKGLVPRGVGKPVAHKKRVVPLS